MGQSYTHLVFHLIFAVKDRQQTIMPDIQERLYAYIGGIIRNEEGKLLCAGGTPDHVHLLASLHPSKAVADILRVIKTNSSKWIHETFQQHRHHAWQEGYGAFSVSQSNIDYVKKYIANQKEHHRSVGFEQEFVDFIKRHKISYDERYVRI